MDELFNKILFRALTRKATDIHLTLRTELCIQFRIFGKLKDYQMLEEEKGRKLMNYIKYKSFINTNYKHLPQTGRFSFEIQNKQYDLRTSYLPTLEFESIVIRILNNHDILSIEHLTFQNEIKDSLYWLTHQDSGLFLISGATGSGKSTTLYTILKEMMKQKNKNIITIEDPVEVRIQNCLQIELNEKIGINYHETLKQILRHDPDVIMIGEIRDEKTAKIAITSALTGHLVLTTIHASTAPLSMKRLMNLGVSQTDLLDVMLGALSQRIKYDEKKKKVIVLSEYMNKKSIIDYLENNHLNYLSFHNQAQKLIHLGFDETLFEKEMAYE